MDTIQKGGLSQKRLFL